jgi:glycosyltransferase involved in cell wall biosynthesis
MTQPRLFSIIIPTYNREDFIENTLNSVFEQTYSHYEVIVVDNCSTDNTQAILKPYADAGRIRLIKHSQNFERARSRNTGMENAVGDFLTFLDSDDFMYPENLADAVGFVQKNPDAKCFHNLYELVDEQRTVISRYKFAPFKDRVRQIADGNFMGCIGNFIHRDIYNKYSFDTNPELTGGEDWEFWLRVLADHDVGRIEKYNSGVLQHPGRSINNQNVDSMERGLVYLVEKFRRDEHLSEVYARYLDRIEATSFMYLNVLANDGHLGQRANLYLRKAIKSDKSMIFSMRFLRSLRRTILSNLRGGASAG